jgi:hypothetical protein
MKPIGTGTIGPAVKKAPEEGGKRARGRVCGRKSGDNHADIFDPESLKAFFSKVGPFDAVTRAAGMFLQAFTGRG